jgi:hypothetical protein
LVTSLALRSVALRLRTVCTSLRFTFIVWAISGGKAMNRGAHQLALG